LPALCYVINQPLSPVGTLAARSRIILQGHPFNLYDSEHIPCLFPRFLNLSAASSTRASSSEAGAIPNMIIVFLYRTESSSHLGVLHSYIFHAILK
jgi:hypothetical protein